MIKKIRNLKFVIRNYQRGMTYVELIVVLSIFSVLSSVVLFNYGDFQAKVDIKNLASDIALKIVEAQKSSLNGVLPATYTEGWKPSYGVYFETATPTQLIYFANFNNDYNDISDIVLDQPLFPKNIYIDKLEVVGNSCPSISSLSIVFRRPDFSAILTSQGAILSCASYIQITIKSPKGAKAYIKIYPSGRVQVN